MALKFLARARLRLADDLVGSELRWKYSPILFDLSRRVVPALRSRVAGRLLDVGCGAMPFRPYLADRVEVYDGLDVERRSPETRIIGDAQDMREISDGSYDTVVSFSTIEHLPRPWLALAEMRRVCRPGGHVIVVAPHLTRLHEEPHDYFRFTPHGLSALAEESGLETVAIEPLSGLFAFIGHQVSTLLVCSFWGVPCLKWIVFWLNYLVVVRLALALDGLLGTPRRYPANVLAVFRVPS
jgi:SAM-dependent methyltransferase